jgi:hypothetical protein
MRIISFPVAVHRGVFPLCRPVRRGRLGTLEPLKALKPGECVARRIARRGAKQNSGDRIQERGIGGGVDGRAAAAPEADKPGPTTNVVGAGG